MHIDHSEYTILLADDSVSNLEKMKSLLAGENFKLLPTLEADEVFLLAKLRLPDMIIIRLALEEGKGVTVVRQLKQSALTKQIPILYMTIPNRYEDFRKVVDYEGVEFVSRPLSKRELILRINYWNHSVSSKGRMNVFKAYPILKTSCILLSLMICGPRSVRLK